jgi:hypothetical protein
MGNLDGEAREKGEEEEDTPVSGPVISFMVEGKRGSIR